MNLQRITLTAFIAYFCMSGVLSVFGLISGQMASHFETSVTEITARFGWLTTGLLIGSALAIHLTQRVELRRLQVLVFSVVALSLMSLRFLPLQWVWPALGATGVGLGVGLAGAALTIARSYSEERRASMLVVTDASFSISGWVCSTLALMFLAREFHWSASYLFVGGLAMLLVLLALGSAYPAEEQDAGSQPALAQRNEAGRWSKNIWLCIAALCLYTLGQYAMLWWLPAHLQATAGVTAELAGSVVGRFWAGMFVAQLVVSWWVLRVGVVRLLLLGSLFACLFSLPLWLIESVYWVSWLGGLWGFMNLAFLKIAISFATQLQKPLSPRLVSALLFGATIGTAVSPIVTSSIVEYAGTLAVLQFSSLCYAGIFNIALFVVWRSGQWPLLVPARTG